MQLHALDPMPVVDALVAARIDIGALGVDARLAEVREAARTTSAGFDGVLRWLDNHRPAMGPAVVCHGDIHPFNMLVTARRDRSTCSIGPTGTCAGASTTWGSLRRCCSARPLEAPRIARARGRRDHDLAVASFRRCVPTAVATDQPRCRRVVRDAAIRALRRCRCDLADRSPHHRRQAPLPNRRAGNDPSTHHDHRNQDASSRRRVRGEGRRGCGRRCLRPTGGRRRGRRSCWRHRGSVRRTAWW